MINNSRLDQILNKVKKHGYSLTPQRYEIIRILAESKNHPSAVDVYSRVKSVYPMISLNTVYKNIAMLLEINEVREIKSFQSAVRYDGDVSPHAHIICRSCKEIIDLQVYDDSNDEMTEIYINPKLKKEYNITGYNVEFFGLCNNCKNKTSN
jgi:Fur family peroxide stress response transcriptional regulator